MKFEERIQTKEELKEWINKGKKFVLFGDKTLIIILLRYFVSIRENDKVRGLAYLYTKKEHMAFDEFVVKPVEEYKADESSQLIVLGRSEDELLQLKERVKEWNEKQICYVDYSLLAFLSSKDNVNLNFLCVGFTKCGTTSLYRALRKNKKIYMPKEKESLYGKWKDQYLDGPERFREMYFSGISKKRKWGCIEPTYFRRADFVYESFGTSPKIIFMLRNPADATYSYFKMMMRRSGDPIHRMYFKKYKRYSPKMFQEYMNDYIFSGKDNRFLYDIWLKEYLRYYDRDSIKLVFFEEIIKEPDKILRDIQEFIGVKPLEGMELPHSNTGKQVSKSYFCARVNGKLHKRTMYYKENGTDRQRARFKKLRSFLYKYTLIDNDERIAAADKDLLMDYYGNSIKEVEQIAGRSLKGLWY